MAQRWIEKETNLLKEFRDKLKSDLDNYPPYPDGMLASCIHRLWLFLLTYDPVL
jgi:hypothetical protein